MPGSHLSPKMSVLSQVLMGLLFGMGNIGSEGGFQLSLALFTAFRDKSS